MLAARNYYLDGIILGGHFIDNLLNIDGIVNTG